MRIDPDDVRFDLELTRRNFDHDETLLREIGCIFIEDVPVLVERLVKLRRDNIDRTNSEGDSVPGESFIREARRVAHSIKGLAATFGAQPLVGLAQEIESSPQSSIELASGEKVLRLSEVAQRTVKELAAQLSLPHNPSAPS